MNRFFSTKLYIQGLKKVRAAGIATAIIIIIANALFPLFAMINEIGYHYDGDYQRTIEELDTTLVSPLCAFIILLAPLMTFSMFSFLNDRCKSDFYHSLPQKRECVFISFLSATLTWMIGAIVASHLVNALLWNLVPYCRVSLTTTLLSLAAFVILTLLMTAFASLATSVTGTTVSNTLITLLFALFFRILGALFLWAVETQSAVFIATHSPLKYLSFDYYLPYAILDSLLSGNDSSAFSNAAMLLFALGTAIALLALSGFLFCKRRSESAGKSAPNKFMQHVWRIAITLPLVLLTFVLILDEGLEGYHFILLIVSLIVYLVFELMTTKKPKNMLRSIPLFFVTIGASIAVLLGSVAAGAIINSKTPSPDEIRGICAVNTSSTSTYEQLVVSDIFIGDDEAAEIVSQALEYSTGTRIWNDRRYTMPIKIKLENGSVIVRKIYITEDDRDRLNYLLTSAPEVNEAYLALPSDSEITTLDVPYVYIERQADIRDIWECFCAEYKTLTSEQKLIVKGISSTGYAKPGYDYGYDEDYVYKDETEKTDTDLTNISRISVQGYRGLQPFYSSYAIIPALMPETSIKFIELYNAQEYSSEYSMTFDELYEAFLEIELPDDRDVEFSLNVSAVASSAKSINIGDYYNIGDASRDSDYQKFLDALAVIAEANKNTEFSDISRIYKVTVAAGELFESPYSDKESGEVWYDYVHSSFYIIISDEQYQSLSNILSGKQ